MVHGQLPLYYKNSRTGGPSSTRRWTEYYLLIVTVFGFLMLFAGVLWFVPSVESVNSYPDAYHEFTRVNYEVTGVSPQPVPSSPSPIPSPNSNLSQSISSSEIIQQHIVSEHSISSEKVKNQDSISAVVNSSVHKEDGTANAMRRDKVVQMVKHAWDGYAKYAFGDNELKPISKRGHSANIFGKNTKLGATIVDSLDTLYLMGLMEEFNQAKEWVRTSLDLSLVKVDVSVFEFNIRFAGGLLSAYALSGDTLFKDKAVEIADKLLPAFKTPSGIPKSLINFATGGIKNWGWASGGSSVLAEFGSLHLEFQYLTYLTGNPIYLEKVSHIRQHLKGLQKPDGLYPNFLNPNTGNWGTKHVSLGALGDSFYEYLLKSWLITSKHDVEAREMYYGALVGIDQHLVRRTGDGTVYLSDRKNSRLDNKMQHLACFAGGMFALGSVHAINGQAEHYLDLGKQITSTCHNSYVNTATHLGPESFRFDSSGHTSSRNNEKMYLLRPETVESYFILWRTTHDQKYRDWGWDVVEALEKHCRIASGGYSGIKDVFNPQAPKDDVQQSFFIAETLKYLWLLFSDDDVVNLNEWVFNTEAHPLPVIPKVPVEQDHL